jgi:hypothetical protein
MQKALALAALGSAGAIGIAAVAMPALASSGSTTHTLKFIAVDQKQTQPSKRTFVEDDQAERGGKVIGFGILDGRITSSTGGVGVVAFGMKGGLVYAKVTINNTPTTTGTITGGTGSFKGARGTISVTNLNKSGSRARVTIRYHS